MAVAHLVVADAVVTAQDRGGEGDQAVPAGEDRQIDLNGAWLVLRSGHADTVLAEIWSLLALFQILLRLADAAITAHLDGGGDPIDLEQISIKNARGALRRTMARPPPSSPR